MRGLLFLIRVSRPIVWFLLPTVYYLGMHASHAKWSSAAIFQLVLLTLPMNLIGCGLNDIFDYESDRLCARRDKIWGVVVDKRQRPLVWCAALAMTLLVFFGALLTRNLWNIAATTGLIMMAWAYSVPPPRLKERPPLDSLANGLGYFLFPLVMGYSQGADPRTMPLRYYLLALCVGGVHALAAAADYEVDRAAGHRTIAVAYGKRPAAAIAMAAFLAAWLIGDFESRAVRVYLVLCTIGALEVFIAPNEKLVSSACVMIFVGFPVAAAFYLFGW
jgi:4-hydroxybenzoate polyprenyltransferase